MQDLTEQLAQFTLGDRRMLESIAEWASAENNWTWPDDETLEARRREALESLGRHRRGNVPLFQVGKATEYLVEGRGSADRSKPPGEQAGLRARSSSESKSLLAHTLQQLAGSYLSLRNGRIGLKYERLLDAQDLLGRISFEPIWCYAVAVRCLGEDPASGRLRNFGDEQLESLFRGALLPVPNEVGVDYVGDGRLVEVHRHLNGSTLPGLVWPECLKDPSVLRREADDPGDLLHPIQLTIRELTALIQTARGLRRHLLAFLLEDEPLASAEEGEEKSTWTSSARGLLGSMGQSFLTQQGRSLDRRHFPGYDIGLTDYPASELSGGRNEPLTAERAFLHAAFRELVQLRRGETDPRAETFDAALHAYLVIQNLTRQGLVQAKTGQEGLDRFVESYADSELRERLESIENIGHRLVQARRTGRIDHLELRLSPSRGCRQKVMEIHNAISARKRRTPNGESEQQRTPLFDRLQQDESRGEAQLQPDEGSSLPGVGIVFHFIRKPPGEFDEPSKNRLSLSQFAERRATVWKQGRDMLRALTDPLVREYVVALDVAGHEPTVPHEVFAPTIRYLRLAVRHLSDERSELEHLRDNFSHPLQSLSCTCHAGESFHHLLSGIRSVDEAVTFLDLREGDRIGHGLALGLDPDQWLERVGPSVMMTRGERLDDLVWLYARLEDRAEFGDVAREIRSEMRQIVRHLYGHSEARNKSPELLHRAWQFRHVDPAESRRERWTYSNPSEIRPGVFLHEEYEAARDELGEQACNVFEDYHFDDALREKRDETIEVELQHEWFEAIRHVQDTLLDELRERRIAIEANPSSNLAVAGLDDLTEHPIFRWFDPEGDSEGPNPAITVGTDDPGIFATELVHEYAFLAKAAEERGAEPREVWEWLDRLRSNGFRFSFMEDTHPERH